MVLFVIILCVLFWYMIKVYNRVKPLEISINESESNIGIILKKREVILDKMNDIVNSYSKYEKDIVEKMSNDMKDGATSLLNLNRLYDAYPDLKLNDTFMDLMERLYNIETERQNTIKYYNSNVRDYNEAVTSFPALIICNMISFKEKTFFVN